MVMIVDDDADDRELFCEALHEVDTSVQCIACSSGTEALNMLKGGPQLVPDYIFLDLNMPRMNGWQCLHELKRMDGFKDVAVVIYTTSKIPEDTRNSKNRGALHFITKPNSFSDLRLMIRTVLSNKMSGLDAAS